MNNLKVENNNLIIGSLTLPIEDHKIDCISIVFPEPEIVNEIMNHFKDNEDIITDVRTLPFSYSYLLLDIYDISEVKNILRNTPEDEFFETMNLIGKYARSFKAARTKDNFYKTNVVFYENRKVAQKIIDDFNVPNTRLKKNPR